MVIDRFSHDGHGVLCVWFIETGLCMEKWFNVKNLTTGA